MLEINEKSHISVIIGSLNKIYKEAKIHGRLYPRDIYYLQIIYKLLDGCPLTLTNTQRRDLVSCYNKLAFQSKHICQPKIIKGYQMSKKPIFIQAENTDCNTFPTQPVDKIFYWQETDIDTTGSDIEILAIIDGFTTGKDSATYSIFEESINIVYTSIGITGFLCTGSSTINYEIKDELGLDITDEFDIVVLPEITATLITSKNIMSHGTMNIRIKKLN
jgi:hypothetical protein